ncbi:hypothetical protein PsorP6_008847 [Peronosclerospora sorghi]|uniref:Uncharacterized protein n=1 Tax=Peronosclerospora sorghi TaxID=230839 RepID=A0ACC0W1D8_9STRA|nr:hypothetical protein PsorP6_008847 [Peronosclerospora sorghi]
MPLKTLVVRFLRRHLVLLLFLVTSSIIAAIVYDSTGGGKPKSWVYDDPALNAVDLEGPDRPRNLWTDEEFECLGWRATHNCDPYGPRDFARDRTCADPMPRSSGFCEVLNRTSGEILRVMLSTCKSWQWYLVPLLSCNDARRFTDFSIYAARYTHPPPELPPRRTLEGEEVDKRGIVMIAYPKVVAGLYAIVRTLRFLGCALPVEVWIDPTEMRAEHSVLVELVKHYNARYRIQCKMRRLGQYTCFMINPRTPDGSTTPSLIISLENTKYMSIEKYAIGYSIEGRGFLTSEEEAEVAKIEAEVQSTRDKETAAIMSARERSEKQTRTIFGAVIVVALGVWLRWQWKRQCIKDRPKLETKHTSPAISSEDTPSHVLLAVDPTTFGTSSAIFTGKSYNYRRRNSSTHLED